eukprot:scaffold20728_cov132-Isochrysis_galbana.AAC.4
MSIERCSSAPQRDSRLCVRLGARSAARAHPHARFTPLSAPLAPPPRHPPFRFLLPSAAPYLDRML